MSLIFILTGARMNVGIFQFQNESFGDKLGKSGVMRNLEFHVRLRTLSKYRSSKLRGNITVRGRIQRPNAIVWLVAMLMWLLLMVV